MKKIHYFWMGSALVSPLGSASIHQISLKTGPFSVQVNSCSPGVQVVPTDSKGRAVLPQNSIRVLFSNSNSSLSFYSDSKCLNSVTSIDLSSKNPSESIYFKAMNSGQAALVVSSATVPGSSQVESVLAASPPTSIPPPVQASSIVGITLDNVSNAVRGAEISAIQHLVRPVMARVVFDEGMSAAYYSNPVTELKQVASIMGQIADSSTMKSYTVGTFQARAQEYVQALKGVVDVWEVGNEVNGNWLGTGTFDKIKAAYQVVKSNQGRTALTFFYMGEPGDPANCIDRAGGDQFTWINTQFQLGLSPSLRDPATEAMRLGLDQVLVSWYPDGCPGLNPDWSMVFNRLASIFPNSKVGFGELGTTQPQGGSAVEASLIQNYYPMASRVALPASYIGGYFWWYFAEEMTPYGSSSLFNVLNQSIR